MHFHYFTLFKLQQYFQLHWENALIVDIFTQNRRELIIQTDCGTLRIGCNTPMTYLVPVQDYNKAGRNVKDLLTVAVGRRILRFELIPFERVMVLELEEGLKIVLKMHGARANVLLYAGDKLLESFLKRDELYFDFQPGYWNEEAIQALQSQSSTNENDILALLKPISPVFDKAFARRIAQLLPQHPNLKAAFEALQAEIRRNRFFVYKDEQSVHFSLFPVEGAGKSFVFVQIEEALAQFLKLHFQYESYLERYTELQNEIEIPFQKLEQQINSLYKTQKQLSSERSGEEIGHLIMSNLHLITDSSTEVEVEDYYNDYQKLKIKLIKDVSPSQKAVHYYQKQKDRKQRLQVVAQQLEEAETKLMALMERMEAFQKLSKPAALSFGEQAFPPEAFAQLKQFEKLQQQQAIKSYPFRHFEYKGWQIFVGKNSKNNDELLKFAGKNDMWLHAKDVSGSHVLVRQQPGKSIPKEVLEYAGGLAAWFSKMRTQSLVPVIFTPRKYVRKRKGFAAGMVLVDKEEVMMAEPQKV